MTNREHEEEAGLDLPTSQEPLLDTSALLEQVKALSGKSDPTDFATSAVLVFAGQSALLAQTLMHLVPLTSLPLQMAAPFIEALGLLAASNGRILRRLQELVVTDGQH
jgi:hypothetical protein